MSLYSIENQQLKFTFDTDDGLMCRSIYHKAGKKEWLKEESPPFVLKIQDKYYPANEFLIEKSRMVSDSRDQCLIFELRSRKWDLRVRLSVMKKEEAMIFLLQAGALWEEGPEEVYLHIPLFRKFIETGSWILSANPRGKPDGTSAMETHEEFPLPICHIEKNGRGIMMELPDDPEFTGTWNQNRNRQLLQMTDMEEFLNHELLLRLQNRKLADILELDFSALEEGYKEAFFRFKRHVREQMDLSAYEGEDLRWYRKALFHHLTFAYSKEIFNYETQQFEVDRLLEEGQAFGGYDILVLWFVYPRLGVDSRKQWDFCRDIPGGLEGINKICKQAHKKGVRVMLPYNPWDKDEGEALEDTLEKIGELVEKTEIDGIWFDTMDSVPPGCKERIEKIRPGVICCLEVTPKVKETVEKITGSWNQRFRMPEGHIFRYLFPEHAAPITSRWRVGEKKDLLIKRAIFNGTGFAVWQDVFGAWLPFSSRQKADLKKWKALLLENYDVYFGKDCMPLYPVLQNEIYVNVFFKDNGEEEIYSIYNASEQEVSGPLFYLDKKAEKNQKIILKELWHEGKAEFSMKHEIISGKLEPEMIYILKIYRRKCE